MAAESTTTTTTTTSTPPRLKSVTLQIMVVGGDGTVHEIVNGILRGLEGTEFISDEFRPRIEFGIIPEGTGNAIATSIGATKIDDALEKFFDQSTVQFGVMTVSTRSSLEDGEVTSKTDNATGALGPWQPRVYSVVVNSFGLHCATVYDSEEFRHLGNERFRQAAMKNIEHLKQYKGKVSIHGLATCFDRRSHLDAVSAEGEIGVVLPGPFTYFLASKQAYLEPGFQPAPFARAEDPWIDLLVVQNANQKEILDMFGQTATGQHIRQPKVEYYRVQAFELETPEEGRLCIDGEFMTIGAGPQGAVRIEIEQNRDVQLFYLYK
ncbi:hypothetical protein BGZ94_001079 [Podila epigama]|nr:hypothetical protein BGZ94_001079 [Podila epigama]